MGGRSLEVGHRQQRVRRRLQKDEVGAGGRRAGLVELDVPDAPLGEPVEESCMTVVGAGRERDGRAGSQQRQDDGRHGPHAGGEEERAPALEPAEFLLDRRARRVVGPGVREPAGLSRLVRPGRRAIDGDVHAATLARSPGSVLHAAFDALERLARQPVREAPRSGLD